MPLGHPIASWQYEEDPEARTPTPSDLGGYFDDLERVGELPADAWLALRRLATTTKAEPIQFGSLILYPENSDFNPDSIADSLAPPRYDALASGEEEPTEAELAAWREVRMEDSRLGGVGGFVVYGWRLVDDRGRERFMATLHGDHAAFLKVAGLYLDQVEAAAELEESGEFEWLW